MVVLLGVVKRSKCPHLSHANRIEIEQYSGGYERASETASPRLVGSCDPTGADGAVMGDQPRTARSAARGLAFRARGGRSLRRG